MTAKTKLFIEKYLGDARLNAAKAARLAGYSRATAKEQGYRLLSQPDVRRAIDDRLRPAALSADEAMFLLSEHARGTVEPFLYDEHDDDELSPRGTLRLDTEAAKENAHLLKEVSQVTTDLGDGLQKTTVKIKLHDPQTALVQLLRARGVFKGSDDLIKGFDVSLLSNRQLERLKAGEDLLRVMLHPDPADVLEAELGEVEDDLPPALPAHQATARD